MQTRELEVEESRFLTCVLLLYGLTQIVANESA